MRASLRRCATAWTRWMSRRRVPAWSGSSASTPSASTMPTNCSSPSWRHAPELLLHPFLVHGLICLAPDADSTLCLLKVARQLVSPSITAWLRTIPPSPLPCSRPQFCFHLHQTLTARCGSLFHLYDSLSQDTLNGFMAAEHVSLPP